MRIARTGTVGPLRLGWPDAGRARLPILVDVPGRRRRATSRRWPASCSPPATTCACSRRTTDDTRATALRAPRHAAAARASRPTGWSRSARRSAGRRTAPSRTSRPRRRRSRRCGASCAPGGFDVVHVHEPVAPVIGWDALTSADAPLVGTFHCYSESRPPHAVAALLGARRKLNRLTRADRRLRGRRLDRAGASTAASTGSSPTASTLPAGGVPAPRAARAGRAAARSSSSARPSSARACRSCCARSRRCASTCPRGSTIVGASEPEVAPLLVDRDRRHRARPRVRRARSTRRSRAPTCSPRRRSAASRSAWS